MRAPSMSTTYHSNSTHTITSTPLECTSLECHSSVSESELLEYRRKPHVGEDGDPVAEKTKLGWFVMSPEADFDKTTVLLTQTSQSDYENLCRLDVLGIADSGESDHEMVYQDFKEQLQRSPDGWYEANLPWKPHHTMPH